MAQPIHSVTGSPPPAVRPSSRPTDGTGASFAETLAKTTASPKLRFSAHARNRLASRNIELDAGRLAQLARATDQAAAKGARDSLVLLNDLGLIVNVPTRTVVTALDAERMNNGVFTNIDSTVIIRDT